MDLFTNNLIKNTKEGRVNLYLDEVEDEERMVKPSYYSNLPKENLCLEYCDNFQAQFKDLYPKRRKPLISIKNEFGTDKIICTFLKPTQLPFESLYEYGPCAKFISDLIQYEPITSPYEPPTSIVSPNMTLEWCLGDSMDLSILLCSYLLGSGYDSHVVWGYAPGNIVLSNRANEICPFIDMLPLDEEMKGERREAYEFSHFPEGTPPPENKEGMWEEEEEEEEKKNSSSSTNESKVKRKGSSGGGGGGSEGKEESKNFMSPPIPDSQYTSYCKYRAKKMAQVPVYNPWEAEDDYRVNTSSYDTSSSTSGKKNLLHLMEDPRSLFHSWVAIFPGKREMRELIFIEPSSGRIFRPSEAPYLAIEGMWNSTNYWVNMQTKKPFEDLKFDLDDRSSWESVFYEPLSYAGNDTGTDTEDDHSDLELDLDELGGGGGGGKENEGGGNDLTNNNNNKKDSNLDTLHMPASWVESLHLSRMKFDLKYAPDGNKTTYFKMSKIEQFGRGNHLEGLVLRITIYKDLDRTQISEIHEWFEMRRDKLERRYRNPFLGLLREFFGPGSEV